MEGGAGLKPKEHASKHVDDAPGVRVAEFNPVKGQQGGKGLSPAADSVNAVPVSNRTDSVRVDHSATQPNGHVHSVPSRDAPITQRASGRAQLAGGTAQIPSSADIKVSIPTYSKPNAPSQAKAPAQPAEATAPPHSGLAKSPLELAAIKKAPTPAPRLPSPPPTRRNPAGSPKGRSGGKGALGCAAEGARRSTPSGAEAHRPVPHLQARARAPYSGRCQARQREPLWQR